MFAGSTKKFLICCFVALAVFAAIGMTPETHRKSLLKPILAYYDDDTQQEPNNDFVELSQEDKVIAISEDLQLSHVDIEKLPVLEETPVDSDSSPEHEEKIQEEKEEAILG